APFLPVVDQKDILLRHKILANEVLRSFPSACVAQLKNFYVRYDNPSRRGLAGKTTIILSGKVADDEFKALLVHEFGHITDLGCMNGTDTHRPSPFKDGAEVINMDDPSVSFYSVSWTDSKTKRPGSSEEDFVSGYASWDPFEDFAETFAYFVLQKDAFRERARENPVIAAKYRWMQQNAFNNYSPIATGEHEWTGEVPWDVTKLAYSWN
ncbi:putative zinc-binding metallopeptidase, partial [Patescibacteria group bacterium]|nr:putative zinc-binding metallopeptidase [Patescibacteria group bacterium]